MQLERYHGALLFYPCLIVSKMIELYGISTKEHL